MHNMAQYSLLCIDEGETCRFLRNFKNVRSGCVILKLVSNFIISNLCSTISKSRKFASCAEHVYTYPDQILR